MNITSILITIVGIIIIIALYLMSRIAQSKLPQKRTSLLPDLKDENGNKFSSVLDDIPAKDGYKPATATSKQAADKDKPQNKNNDADAQQQKILFITASDNSGLDGNLIKKALKVNGLVLGDRDIYHYIVETPTGKSSLFRIANGVAPWTLKEDDLSNKKIAGLSLVMLIPSKIDDKKAISTYIKIAEKLATAINGVLKNQQQQPLTEKDKKSLIA